MVKLKYQQVMQVIRFGILLFKTYFFGVIYGEWYEPLGEEMGTFICTDTSVLEGQYLAENESSPPWWQGIIFTTDIRLFLTKRQHNVSFVPPHSCKDPKLSALDSCIVQIKVLCLVFVHYGAWIPRGDAIFTERAGSNIREPFKNVLADFVR